MKSTDNVGTILVPIASSAASGNTATVPMAQANPGDGTASIELGFPPETFIDRAAGGVPPRGQDMNGLLNLLSLAIRALQAGYIAQFNANFAQAIGGYPYGAIVAGSTAGTFWVSTADNNGSVPGQAGAAWQNLFSGYLPLSGGTLSGSVTIQSTPPQNPQPGQDINYNQIQFASGGRGGNLQIYLQEQVGSQFAAIFAVGQNDGTYSALGLGRGSYIQYNSRQLAFDDQLSAYATVAALTAETQRASTIESNLQSSKANLAGGNSYQGDQTVNGSVFAGFGTGWSGSTTTGQGRWSNGHLAFGSPDSSLTTYTGYFQITDLLGSPEDNYSGINMFGYDYSGARHDWQFPWNGNIITPKGAVAFQADLAAYALLSSFASSAGDNWYMQFPTASGQKMVFMGVKFTGTTTSGQYANGRYETTDIYVSWPVGLSTLCSVVGTSVDDVSGAGQGEQAWVMSGPTTTGGSFRLACNSSGQTMSGRALIVGIM